MPRSPSWARTLVLVLLALLPLRGITQVVMAWGDGPRGSAAAGVPMLSCHEVSAASPGSAAIDAHTAVTATGSGHSVADEGGPAHGDCRLCDLCHGAALPAWQPPADATGVSLPCPPSAEADTVQRDPRALDKPPRR